MSGKSCNPCNQVPWVPMVNPNIGQYAPHNVGSSYQLPAPSQGPSINVVVHDVSPPIYDAKPFRDSSFVDPVNYNLQIQHSNFDHNPPRGFDHSISSGIEYATPPNIQHHTSSNDDFHHSTPTFEHHSSSNNDGPPPQFFNHQPSSSSNNFEQHGPILSNNDGPPSQIFDHHESQSSNNFEHQGPVYNPNESSNSDNQRPVYHPQESPNFGEQNPSPVYHPQEFDFDPRHGPTDFLKVVDDNSSDSENHDQEPDHAESQPIGVDSETPNKDNERHKHSTTEASVSRNTQNSDSNPRSTLTFHFQRSPIIDLSIAGESTTASYQSTPQTVTHRPELTKISSTMPPDTVLDYILSSPDESSESAERQSREWQRNKSKSISLSTSSTTTTSSTTIRSTTPLDSRQPDSILESFVQSFEFYKKNSTKANEVPNEIRYNGDGTEEIVPSKDRSGKRNKQVNLLNSLNKKFKNY